MSFRHLGLCLTFLFATACGGGGGDPDSSGPPVSTPTPPISPAPTSVTTSVPLQGGLVSLAGVADLFFIENSFIVPTDVSISMTTVQSIDDIYVDTTQIYQPTARSSYEIRFNVGTLPVEQAVSAVAVNFSVPTELQAQVSAGSQAEVLVLMKSDGGEEELELFDLVDSVNDVEGTITTAIPTRAFKNTHTVDGTYEAVVLLAITPLETRIPSPNRQATSAVFSPSVSVSPGTTICPADPIQCPTESVCTVTSEFMRNLQDPVSGKRTDHFGTDYAAVLGSEIRAAKAGKVIRSYAGSSFGNTIIINHDDGSRSLYAHLLSRNVLETDPLTEVAAGDLIGLSSNSGSASLGEHLHFEYVPSGPTIYSKQRIDPHFCIANPSPAPDPFVGTWDVTETLSSDDPECPDDSSRTGIEVNMQGTSYDVAFQSSSMSAAAVNGVLTVSASITIQEAGGTTTEDWSGSFSAAGLFTGFSSWTWTRGSSNCSGTSVYEGFKQGN